MQIKKRTFCKIVLSAIFQKKIDNLGTIYRIKPIIPEFVLKLRGGPLTLNTCSSSAAADLKFYKPIS